MDFHQPHPAWGSGRIVIDLADGHELTAIASSQSTISKHLLRQRLLGVDFGTWKRGINRYPVESVDMFLEWSRSLEPTWIWGQSWNRLMCGSSSGLRIGLTQPISGWSNTPNEGHFPSLANGTSMFGSPMVLVICSCFRGLTIPSVVKHGGSEAMLFYYFLLVKLKSCTSRLIPAAISPC